MVVGAFLEDNIVVPGVPLVKVFWVHKFPQGYPIGRVLGDFGFCGCGGVVGCSEWRVFVLDYFLSSGVVCSVVELSELVELFRVECLSRGDFREFRECRLELNGLLSDGCSDVDDRVVSCRSRLVAARLWWSRSSEFFLRSLSRVSDRVQRSVVSDRRSSSGGVRVLSVQELNVLLADSDRVLSGDGFGGGS